MDLIHLKLVRLYLHSYCLRVWLRIILSWVSRLLSFLGSVNVITKTTYNSQSYNSPNSVILVYSDPLQLRLFFSLLCFSLLVVDCSQPLTSFYFLWIFRSYSLWFLFHLLLILFFHFIIFL